MSRSARAPAASVDPHTAAISTRLTALVQQAPELAEPAALYQAMLPHLRAAQAALPPPELDLTTARRSLAAGLPILLGTELDFDARAAAQLFIDLCHAAEAVTSHAKTPRAWSFGARTAPANGPVSPIRRAVEQGTLDLGAVWQALAVGDDERLSALAADLGLEAGWLRLLGQNSLKPALRVMAEGLSHSLGLDDWQRGSCPICGSLPLLAEVQGKEGARRLRCGLCGVGWSYPRLQCVFCRTTDSGPLGYLCLEGEGDLYRLQTCEVCRGYIKVVVTFDPIPVYLLPVVDLATLHLDSLATQQGFTSAPVPA